MGKNGIQADGLMGQGRGVLSRDVRQRCMNSCSGRGVRWAEMRNGKRFIGISVELLVQRIWSRVGYGIEGFLGGVVLWDGVGVQVQHVPTIELHELLGTRGCA